MNAGTLDDRFALAIVFRYLADRVECGDIPAERVAQILIGAGSEFLAPSQVGKEEPGKTAQFVRNLLEETVPIHRFYEVEDRAVAVDHKRARAWVFRTDGWYEAPGLVGKSGSDGIPLTREQLVEQFPEVDLRTLPIPPAS